MNYKLILSYKDSLISTITNKENLIPIILLLKDSKRYNLISLEKEENYQPCEDVIDLLKKDVKPKNLETNQIKFNS
jgi:hypothetical protein